MQTEGTKTVHQGRNVKRIREILGVKQEALASDLGLTQQAVSQIEQKAALVCLLFSGVSQALLTNDLHNQYSKHFARL